MIHLSYTHKYYWETVIGPWALGQRLLGVIGKQEGASGKIDA